MLDLGGPWQVWLDAEGVGLRDEWVATLSAGHRPSSAPAAALALPVPGPLEGDASTLDYDGIAFYTRKLAVPTSAAGARAVLRFGQVNYACRVWLDGQLVGEHEGGYDAFSFDLTGRLLPGATAVLVVRVVDPGAEPVDGLTLRTTPHAKESWYENYGGLLGPVTLTLDFGWSVRDGSLATQVLAEPGGERVVLSGELLAPPDTDAGARPATITLTATLAPHEVERSGSVSTLTLGVAGDATPFRIEAPLPGAARWSPESPALHRVTLAVDGVPVAERDVGFRTLSIEGGDFRLDGVRRTLKGVLWQPHFTGTGGVLPTDAQLAATARAMKEAGFDLVRAHVRPAPPAFLDAADRLGLLVLEEPAIGWVEDDPGLLPRLQREVSWMVERDRHHPSIVMWGVLNELSGRAYRYADALVERVAQLDATRPVLEDSGAFLGKGHVRPPGAAASVPMVDRHIYPPYPLPIEERDALLELHDPGGGLVFVSEFGHGTLLDTAAALEPFTKVGRMTNERIRFASWAGFARRNRQPAADASGGTGGTGATGGTGGTGGSAEWWQRDWTEQAAQLQADAVEDMLDVLRANPNIDMLCYTQWQAASEESSAGLLGPWGEARPAYEAMRRALAPLRVVTLSQQLSIWTEAVARFLVVAINDGHDASAVASDGLPSGVSRSEPSQVAPAVPGFMTWQATVPAGAEAERSAAVRLRVAARPSPEVGRGLHVWTPQEGPATQFLDHWGYERASAPQNADVVLLADPRGSRPRLTLENWLGLWAAVHRGTAAIVLVPGPAATDERRALGMQRGVQTHTGLPLPVSIAAAPGNFMARVHAVRDGDAVRLLGRGDEAFAPEGMLVGLPPGAQAHMVTLGWLGNRLGEPDVTLPFGRGSLRVIGLPLLGLVKGEVDPSRDEQLALLVKQAAEQARTRLAGQAVPWTAPPVAELDRLKSALDPLDALVALGDRQSPFSGDEPRLPPSIEAALAARTTALDALFEGDTPRAIELLEGAVAPLWTEATQRFIEREAQVLQAWSLRVAEGGEQNWDQAYDVRQAWVAAVADWFRGDAAAAQAGIDRAWELLR